VSEVVSEAVCGVMPSGFMGAFLWIGMGAIVGGVGRGVRWLFSDCGDGVLGLNVSCEGMNLVECVKWRCIWRYVCCCLV
jgi:hypothetical protein